MKVSFQNDFQQKIMTQSFDEPTEIRSPSDLAAWRQAWTDALKSWHSPYKTLIDCSNLKLASTSPELADAAKRMLRFFEGFFLKKAVGFGFDEAKGHGALPFPVLTSEDEAFKEIGMRSREKRAPGSQDFRALIQLQNHFNQHVVELNFAEPVLLSTTEQLNILKSKLTNNLMQWHSKWSLLVDCTNLEVSPEIHPGFAQMEAFFKGFFLKQILGYSPKGTKETYPFPVYRARHNAAGRLESEGSFAGDAADCKSKKT